MASIGISLRSLTASSTLSRFFPLRWKYPHSAGACGWCLGERASAVGVLSAQRTQSRDSLECPRSPLPRISERTETAENGVLDASFLLLIAPPSLRECVLSFCLKFNPTSLFTNAEVLQARSGLNVGLCVS